MSTIKTVIEESLKEFSEKLYDLEGMYGDGIGGNEIDEMKTHLSTTISNILEAVEEEVIEKAWDESGKGDSLITVADIQSIIKSAKEQIK